jgi:hypothetical protein
VLVTLELISGKLEPTATTTAPWIEVGKPSCLLILVAVQN